MLARFESGTSASILFGGGFPRGATRDLRQAAQRAIFHVQHELEATACGGENALVICDPCPSVLWIRSFTARSTARDLLHG